MATNKKTQFNEVFGRNVKNVYKQRGYKDQKELYHAICHILDNDSCEDDYTFSMDTLKSQVSGRAMVGSYRILIAYAKALNTTVDYLLTGNEQQEQLIDEGKILKITKALESIGVTEPHKQLKFLMMLEAKE